MHRLWMVMAASLAFSIAAPGCAAETTDEQDNAEDVEDGVDETSQAITFTSKAQEYNFRAINSYRRARGLPALKLSPTLSKRALTVCRHFVNGESNWHFPDKVKPPFVGSAGENQGYSNRPGDYAAKLDEIMALPENRANLKRNFTRVGIGIIEKNGFLYMTNDFSR